ncbi:hypothetical protein V8C42DRAFT_356814 [Trichoderma barbatum]
MDSDSDDDDGLSTIDLTPSETDASSTGNLAFSHDEDEGSLGDAATPTPDDEVAAKAAASSSDPDDNTSAFPEGEAIPENAPPAPDPSPPLNRDEDFLSDSEAEATQEFSHAEAKYRSFWNDLHDKSRDRKRKCKHSEEKIKQLELKIKRLETENRKLREELAILKGEKARRTQVTWPSLFGTANWETIYSTSCKEGNASPLLAKIHPELRLRKPTEQELQAGLLQTGAPQLQKTLPIFNIPEPETLNEGGKLSALRVQLQILRCLLNFQGNVVHAISRLDPHHQADEVPLNGHQRPSFLHRLHVGRSPVSITFSPHPDVFLAPLLGRFAKGIKANVQRLQHVEILWSGSQYLTFEESARKKYTSRRTFPLAWLAEAIRLKTLGVYLQESSKEYMRRGHEPRGIVQHMKCKTQLHPNFRGFRSLRTVQGMDYVYCLRGLDQAEFWDFDRWLDTKQRKRPVRDWHFIMDVNNAVRRSKEASDRSRSQLKNLFPLLESFVPSEDDWKVLLEGFESHQAGETDNEDVNVSPPPPVAGAGGAQGTGPVSSEAAILIVESGSDEESSADTGSESDSDSSSGSSSGSGSGSDDDDDDDNDDNDDDGDGSPSQAVSEPTVGVDSGSAEANLGPSTTTSTGGSRTGSMMSQLEMLHLMDGPQSDPHQSAMDVDSDSDDESTIVPDDRSVAEYHVVDLTIDGNNETGAEDQLNQGFDQDTAQFSQGSTSGNVEGSLFVSDDGYHPSDLSSLMEHIQGDASMGDDWEANSGGSPPSTEESEESLFIGTEPSHLFQTPSLSATRRQSSRGVSTGTNDKEVVIDLTVDDPTDQFLSDNQITSPESRKRDRFKVEEDEEEKDGGGASESAKRLRT